MKTVLVTGAAGFIGFHTVAKLCANRFNVVGLDNLNDYYSVSYKLSRLQNLGIDVNSIEGDSKLTSKSLPNFRFCKIDLEDTNALDKLFYSEKFDAVIHLAAQAGVRYSIENPEIYIQSNIVGFFNIINLVKKYNIEKLIYASSSSIYGLNDTVPFEVKQNTDRPASLYAATKKSNELIAFAYGHLYNVKTIGLRFFTVYGPWGRPDMAPFLFIESIFKGQPINIYNEGEMERDFTYIDDVVESLYRVLKATDDGDCYQLYNVGKGSPVNLLYFISLLEKEANRQAIKKYKPMQLGDVRRTWADTTALQSKIAYSPKVSIEEGVSLFVKWYKDYYQIL